MALSWGRYFVSRLLRLWGLFYLVLAFEAVRSLGLARKSDPSEGMWIGN